MNDKNVCNLDSDLPEGFVYLSDYDSSILQEVRYAGSDNFLGRSVKGYNKAIIIISEVAAKALSSVQADLMARSLSLKVFDAYRPQSACNDFWEWAKDPSDRKMAEIHYPEFKDKRELFDQGYIARYSKHSRGSTVDLTIVDFISEEEIDMGGPFDYLGSLSHTETNLISNDELKNRLLLKYYMGKHGFKGYRKEWWHFELLDEPFTRKPEDHFNFPVG
jgi:zinc D-Ala-D-Ala dipeptidase